MKGKSFDAPLGLRYDVMASRVPNGKGLPISPRELWLRLPKAGLNFDARVTLDVVAGVTAVPEIAAVTVPAEVATETEALRAPAADGLKTMLTVHCVSAAMVVVQVCVCVKSEALVPEMVKTPTVNGDPPAFDRMMGLAALDVPTFTELMNVRGEGDRAALAAAEPVPVRAAVCEVVTALSDTTSEAGREPIAAGLKVTDMVQLAPTANVAPQVFVME